MQLTETFLRVNGEVVLYATFFGLIIALGLAELVFEMRASGAKRLRRWPVNWTLTFLNIIIMGAVPLSSLVVADFAASRHLGLLNTVGIAALPSAALGILAFSLQSWAVHFAMHHIPTLWRIHRVHHTDTHMDVSTTVRFHPLEIFLNIPVSAVLILVLGLSPLAALIYGIADAAINVFSHSNIRLPARLDTVLSRLVVTPHLHRVHHSTRVPETNSNFGATLPLWDILFGTYRAKSPDELAVQTIGLDEMQDARAYSLWWALVLPFRQISKGADEKTSGTKAGPGRLSADP